MTVSDLRARALSHLLKLAGDVAVNDAMADECGQLGRIAEEAGSIFGPAMRIIAASHRVRAIDLRCRVAALTEDHLQACKSSD